MVVRPCTDRGMGTPDLVLSFVATGTLHFKESCRPPFEINSPLPELKTCKPGNLLYRLSMSDYRDCRPAVVEVSVDGSGYLDIKISAVIE